MTKKDQGVSEKDKNPEREISAYEAGKLEVAQRQKEVEQENINEVHKKFEDFQKDILENNGYCLGATVIVGMLGAQHEFYFFKPQNNT